jgi:uncharacterized cofD-like protein
LGAIRPAPAAPTVEAIANADLITVGPGSLFTSFVPNLLICGISEALAVSRAIKVFVCNLMTESNESLELTAADHIRDLNSHASTHIFNYALVNETPFSPELKLNYAEEGDSQIEADAARNSAIGPSNAGARTYQ